MHRSDLPGAGYIGRFAPSPTGPLHAGSLVAALASWLDARAHRGRWLVRIEDIDAPRCVPGADTLIVSQLIAFGLVPDEPPVWQSQRDALYRNAIQRLLAADLAYPCGCSRREIELALQALGHETPRHAEQVYPGTCRGGLQGKAARAMRLRTLDADGHDVRIAWTDRRLGLQQQDLARAVGDFVLQRADGLWAYQLAVVVDDAEQGVSHVVRGEDLTDNTARQIHLQRLLGLPTPHYLHTPLVLAADGEKLSKQNGAQALSTNDPLAVLRAAGTVLDIAPQATDVPSWLAEAVTRWRTRWPLQVA
ncbi:MAG TPA: tRNA glutamyl-Q(34) synthetase GluQRS [Albitalea sp.]|jgi:glutamyl-Q tRNA(Asp) synthetase|nr:tRNA glutamyl-Q(34) synthetase GluQRS [Albitalea sp.]